MFLPVGSTTAIEWRQDFEFYLKHLTEGLQTRKPSVLSVFRTWDKIFYPNSDESMARDGEDTGGLGEASRSAALESLYDEEPEQQQEEQETGNQERWDGSDDESDGSGDGSE